jgi:hypothetical protein
MPPNGVWQLEKPMIQPVSEEAMDLAKKVVANKRTTPTTPEEIDKWASNLANDVKDATD